MKQIPQVGIRKYGGGKLLHFLNVRPEAGKRTLLMFAFFAITSMGILWLEQTTVALFLAPAPEGFGVKWLPLVYIVSASIRSGLGFFYSWLQKHWPLPKVLMAALLLMVVPLPLLRWGLEIGYLNGIVALVSLFVLRLWLDGEKVMQNLNSQVAANQLFNIREIKRTYPIISSGLFLANVIAGFSLPLLLIFLGLKNTILAGAITIILGGSILFYITEKYKQSFPSTPIRELEDIKPASINFSLNYSLRRYIIILCGFFVVGEVIYLSIEFLYLGQLEINFQTTQQIAIFLGFFTGVLGIFQLVVQWLAILFSPAFTRLGVLVTSIFLPGCLLIVSAIAIVGNHYFSPLFLESFSIVFLAPIGLKFADELLRYTTIASIEPFLFQPLPQEIRRSLQTLVKRAIQPGATLVTGAIVLAVIVTMASDFPPIKTASPGQWLGSILILGIFALASIWLVCAWLLHYNYVNLLLREAEAGRLSLANVNLEAFKTAMVQALELEQTEADKSSCIELLARIDSRSASEVLAPLLVNLSPAMQHQSLKVMLSHPQEAYCRNVQKLMAKTSPIEVLALAMRYVWLSQPELDLRELKPYLEEGEEPVIVGTAASLMLRRGSKREQREATEIIERMMISPDSNKRAMAVQALADGRNSTVAKFYLPQLLRDRSSRVRIAMFEAIVSCQLEEYYYILVKGLKQKYTRQEARKALLNLGNEVLPLLMKWSGDGSNHGIAIQAWNTMAEIGTRETISALVLQLMTSRGNTCRNLLRVFLRMPGDKGIEAILDRLGLSGLESLIQQELLLLGQIYGARLDLNPQAVEGTEADLLRAALEGLQQDILERVFLILKLLYSPSAIGAAMLNLTSDSQSNIAIGLELLDSQIDLPQKQLLLAILDEGMWVKMENLAPLTSITPYLPMALNSRLQRLIDLRHFLSPWSLACCFHLARQQRWNIHRDAIAVCLNHSIGFVREAVLGYLQATSPEMCRQLLPQMKNDSNPLVAAQVAKIKGELGIDS